LSLFLVKAPCYLNVFWGQRYKTFFIATDGRDK
jgi:hypothetical protein